MKGISSTSCPQRRDHHRATRLSLPPPPQEQRRVSLQDAIFFSVLGSNLWHLLPTYLFCARLPSIAFHCFPKPQSGISKSWLNVIFPVKAQRTQCVLGYLKGQRRTQKTLWQEEAPPCLASDRCKDYSVEHLWALSKSDLLPQSRRFKGSLLLTCELGLRN